jgi:hypothetical protein
MEILVCVGDQKLHIRAMLCCYALPFQAKGRTRTKLHRPFSLVERECVID